MPGVHPKPKEVVKTKLKKGDTVKVISGKWAGKTGKILEVLREKNRLVVEGVALTKRHIRPNPAKQIKGGIAERESAIHASNVMLVGADGLPTRLAIKREEDGTRTRIERRTGKTVE